jgi:photosystem II stability/assembly factor-like uncharacterized protein
MRRSLLTVLALTLLLTSSALAQWVPLGPEGGDARSLAYDPHDPDRILIGTSAGQLYISTDAGGSWKRFARLGEGDDYVLDHIAFDRTRRGTIYVSAYSVEHPGGDIFRTRDFGRSWQRLDFMHGRSVRALALAPSDPATIVAGVTEGVFRSRDGGDTWQRISPENHAEIKNLRSVAIDPVNPDIIYIGTSHLPWKTPDGGKTWQWIKQGVIDDSDVFSIIVDPNDTEVVYASACSGIYKSTNAGMQFRKTQGIPSSARRTRKLKQDPNDSGVVYAGTTEGLWKTTDAGATWTLLTKKNVIVNDIHIDPRDSSRVLIATDRSGILASNNGGRAFFGANRGFAHRQVASMVADREDPSTFYAGVINDKEYGGVFVTRDGGSYWMQLSSGLGGRDVFVLRQTADGALIAGTNRGIFQMAKHAPRWTPLNSVVTEKTIRRKGAKPVTRITKSELTARVSDLDMMPSRWFAATSAGLFTSSDQGRTWRGGPLFGHVHFASVRAGGNLVAAATYKGVVVSPNGGADWHDARLPHQITGIYGVAIDDSRNVVWLATREGAFRSADAGHTWDHVLGGLAATNVLSITYDAERRRLLATGALYQHAFESFDGGENWQPAGDAGWKLRGIVAVRGRLFGLTPFDGIVAQPQRSDLPAVAAGSGSGSRD